MEETVVRRAGPEDAEAVCAVHAAALGALAAAPYSRRQIAAWRDDRRPAEVRYALTHLAETMFVAERAGRIIGFAAVRRDEITALFVHPQAGRGAGTRLLGVLEETARARGIRRLSVSASLNAEGFYRRRGYRRVALSTVKLARGVTLDAVEMEKDL